MRNLEVVYEDNFFNYTANYSLKKDWVFPYCKVCSGSDIILYGAGDVGQAYFEQIRMTGYCHIVKWVDKYWDRYEGLGLQIEPVSKIADLKYDFIVIAVFNIRVAVEISKELAEIGVDKEKIVWIGSERKTYRGTVVERRLLKPIEDRILKLYMRRGLTVDDEEVIKYKEELLKRITDKGDLILPRIVVELTPVCTLRCEKCNNLMPYYKHPVHIPVEDVIRDIDRLLGFVDGIITLELIGGEPFCFPRIKDVLEKVIGSEKILEVELTTNGTLIPSDDVIGCLRNNKVTIRVSRYEGINYRRNICETLFKNGIRYESCREMQWIDSGRPTKRIRSKEENQKVYMDCGVSYICKTLYKGRIYACARAASLYDLGICKDEQGYVNLYDSENVKEHIRDFYIKDYDPSCDYCDYTDSWRIIPAGEQIGEDHVVDLP